MDFTCFPLHLRFRSRPRFATCFALALRLRTPCLHIPLARLLLRRLRAPASALVYACVIRWAKLLVIASVILWATASVPAAAPLFFATLPIAFVVIVSAAMASVACWLVAAETDGGLAPPDNAYAAAPAR